MQSPISSFARPVWPPWDLDETIVETQIVPQTVLPTLCVLAIIRKVIHDELVDIRKWQHFLRAMKQSHGRQSNVTVGRLLFTITVSGGSWHVCNLKMNQHRTFRLGLDKLTEEKTNDETFIIV